MTRESLFEPQGRCHSQHQVTVRVTVRCEREYAHGGAHTARVDDVEIDPDYTYVISWEPKEEGGVSLHPMNASLGERIL